MSVGAAAPITVGSLVKRATSKPNEVAGELGGWVLVGSAPVEEAGEWSFRTLSARTLRSADGQVEAVLDESYLVYPLRKARAGPFAQTILIGRSRTNDVCVPHSSVSKLHARIRLADDGLYLSDAGSSNGTHLDQQRLQPDVERPLSHGSQVRFGACAFQVFEPERFTQLLARFSGAKAG